MAYSEIINEIDEQISDINASVVSHQAPTNSHDNPDNGSKAERLAACQLLSPDGVAVVAG